VASAHHHVALRVADMDRAVRFYREAFGARQVTLPFLIEGAFAEMIWGPKGSRVKGCMLGFDEGVVELFEFLSEPEPTGRLEQREATLMHFALKVDDVHDAVAKVRGAGGDALFPVTPWGDIEFVYCKDPDGNVIELTQADMGHLAKLTLDAFPDARPQ
jgi:catechol 2,3-dioxygenase-like lactoylglutathione lyase family enzyme